MSDFCLTNDFEEMVFLNEKIQRLLPLLSPKEKAFLYDRFFLNLPVTKIAEKHAVSRKTVYKWRKQLQETAHFLIDR